MNNKNFTNLNENELYNTEGGCDPITIITLAVAAIGTAYTIYQSNRADAYAEGQRKAYEDIRRS